MYEAEMPYVAVESRDWAGYMRVERDSRLHFLVPPLTMCFFRLG